MSRRLWSLPIAQMFSRSKRMVEGDTSSVDLEEGGAQGVLCARRPSLAAWVMKVGSAWILTGSLGVGAPPAEAGSSWR